MTNLSPPSIIRGMTELPQIQQVSNLLVESVEALLENGPQTDSTSMAIHKLADAVDVLMRVVARMNGIDPDGPKDAS